jgi:hypothetical protein
MPGSQMTGPASSASAEGAWSGTEGQPPKRSRKRSPGPSRRPSPATTSGPSRDPIQWRAIVRRRRSGKGACDDRRRAATSTRPVRPTRSSNSASWPRWPATVGSWAGSARPSKRSSPASATPGSPTSSPAPNSSPSSGSTGSSTTSDESRPPPRPAARPPGPARSQDRHPRTGGPRPDRPAPARSRRHVAALRRGGPNCRALRTFGKQPQHHAADGVGHRGPAGPLPEQVTGQP